MQSLPIKIALFNLMANFLARVMDITLVTLCSNITCMMMKAFFHIRMEEPGEETDLIQLTQKNGLFDRTNVEKWVMKTPQLEEIAGAILDGTTSTLATLNTKGRRPSLQG